MASTGQRLQLRLFLEGVEVPCIAAAVQTAPNAPAMCSLQIPPLAEATRFFPRTLVHCFFLDPYALGSPFVTNTGNNSVSSTNKANPSAYNQAAQKASNDQNVQRLLKEIQDEDYKLLFGGELVGWTWSKSQSSRSIVLQCLDWSNYWDYAYQWNNTDLFGPGIKAMFSGGGTSLFTDFLEEEGQAIIRILQQPSAQYPKLKGLLGGIIHLIEAIGGSYYYGKQFAGENVFFSLAELRLHISQLITAYEADPTSSRLLNADGYDGLFGRTLGGLGQQVSIRQAINALMGVIFHETYSIPTPLYTPGTGGTVTGTVRKPLSNDPRYKNIPAQASAIISAIQNLEQSLNASGANTAQPSTATNAFGETVSSIPAAIASSFQSMSNTLRGLVRTTVAPQLQPVKGYMSSALTSIGKAQAATRKWRPGADSSTLAAITGPLDAAVSQLQQVVSFQAAQTSAGAKIPARLNQQIFRPDVWFSAPPRCNVLFPEHYHDLSYARNFLQEPTRFLLKTNDEFFGEDELFDAFYFAPKAFTVLTQKRNLQGMLSNDLLDHELFTGILPVFEKMGELNIFGARSGTIKGQGVPKIGLAQRSTNFLYFKHRFAARQMTVNGRFNPYVVPGFPGLIVDKWVDAQSLKDRQALIDKFGGVTTDMNQLLGTHFLGNFTQLEHSVDQRSGRTSITISYPRQPEESVEFLGAIAQDQTVQKRKGSDALRSTDVAAFNAPKVLSIGPNGGQITSVQDVTQEYLAASSGQGPTLPLYDGPQTAGKATIKVPVGITQPALSYGQAVAQIVGSPTTPVRFSAWRLKEQVPRYSQTQIDLPAEEYIRPGWYGDCWHPSQVGKVYEQFFQTGAITDLQTITTANGATTGITDEQASTLLASSSNSGQDWSDPKTAQPALLTLLKNSSIQQAVSFLVQTYSQVKLGGYDSDQFISSYVWRPIASMTDMFGSSDLALSADGQTVLQGIEGFHSRAFGPYDNLFGLVSPDITNVVGISRGSTASQRADTRKRKQDAIKQYVAALQFARAILG